MICGSIFGRPTAALGRWRDQGVRADVLRDEISVGAKAVTGTFDLDDNRMVARPGFEKLLAAICEGRVGAVVSIEASRLARNGRDWHTLLEFCGLVGTLIVDEDGVYDPRHPNDRLLLGMKGTMSEMELSVFRQRSLEALKQRAQRGELFLSVAGGLREDPARRPDREGPGSALSGFARSASRCLRSVMGRMAGGSSGSSPSTTQSTIC